MPTLKEAKDKVIELSLKALEVTEDHSLGFAEQKKRLDPLEADIKTWEDEVAGLTDMENKRKQFFAAAGGSDLGNNNHDGGSTASVRKSLGQQFVESSNYKGLIERGLKGGNWASGDIELKATMAEGTAADPGPGFAPVTAVPQLVPGIVDIRFAPLVIADLIPQSGTSSALIRYLIETAVTNAAAATGEGELYPESSIIFDKADEVLHKIATFLPVTDEMLEDWEQIQGYIDARLQLFVRQAEQTQLLLGDGTGDNMVGLLNRTGLATSIVKGTTPSASSDNAMDAIYRQITQIRTTAFMEPDAVVIEPIAWETITLSKNSQGAYYANGPFVGQQPATLWGKKVALTPQMTSGVALVGAFAQCAQIFRKGGLTVAASNSHADFFQRGQTAIRAEERLGLAVYRPGAFGTVTDLNS